MRTGTIFQRYELFVAAATIAAHASCRGEGFRQKDVRFMIELYSNWVETTFDDQVLSIKNTQVLRYLEELVSEGLARRSKRKGKPYYRLSRTGLIDLLGRLIPSSLHIQAEHFFFLYYFISNYRPAIESLIESEGKRFPLALKLEVESLLDGKALLETQLQYAKLELQRLEERIADASRGAALAEKLYQKDLPLLDVAKEIEKQYPYELNSQKPLTELMQEVPEDLGRWELAQGSKQRVRQIWTPARHLLLAYIECLQELKSQDA
jgi:hypothetical protein